jgi:preprotein translocase subunit SecA
VMEHIPADSVEEQWDVPALERRLEAEYFMKLPVGEWIKSDESLDGAKIAERVIEEAGKAYQGKFAQFDPEVVHHYERAVMLQNIDSHWREHLASLEYKREAFELFGAMLDSIKREVTRFLMGIRVQSQEEVQEAERRAEEAAHAVKNVQYHHAGAGDALAEDDGGTAVATADDEPARAPLPGEAPFVRSTQKVGRNDPCPCGSGKKYKQCHGKLA